MKLSERLFGDAAATFKMVASYVIGTIALGFCIFTAWTQGIAPYVQMLICILGGVLGWILGLYMTPSNETEKRNFSDYGKTLTALVSGFGLAKAGDVLELIEKSGYELSSDLSILRILLFSCSLLIAALFTYISRLHVVGSEADRIAKRERLYGDLAEVVEGLKRTR